jgi:16S rRNA processing protein RimM
MPNLPPAKAEQPSKSKKVNPLRWFQLSNRSVDVPAGYLAVGRITSVHGLQGEVQVELHTDFPERFASGVRLFVGQELTEFLVEEVRPHKGQLLLLLEGIADRDEAEALRGEWLFVPESEAVQLEADSYWVHEIIGMWVQTTEKEPLGVVEDVLFTGANQVYVVQCPPGVNNGKELLIPAIADVIRQVDQATRMITVQLLSGLLEEKKPEA